MSTSNTPNLDFASTRVKQNTTKTQNKLFKLPMRIVHLYNTQKATFIKKVPIHYSKVSITLMYY